MHKNFLMRLSVLGAIAGLCLGLFLCPGEAKAANLNTGDFVAACGDDPSVTDDPSFDDSEVTPKAFCECVAAELGKNNLSQKDVDMLTKMHNEDISDADVEAYPTLEDLMNANESFEDHCRQSLGLPTDIGTDMEEEVPEGELLPEENEEAPAEEEAPADDDGSPPE